MMKKLGLIAGNGNLPLMILEYCKKNKIELFCILINNFAELDKYKDFNNLVISFGNIGKAINFLKKNNVKDIVFAGGVKKPSLSLMKMDFKGFLLFKELLKNKIFGDNTLIETIVSFLGKYDINVLEIDSILDNIKFGVGNNTNIKADNYIDDINYGVNILKSLSSFDIGQSIVIQQKNVIGIEAIEGTQKLIERCADLRYKEGKKAILIKIKKENQNRKIDLPTIGPDTIEQVHSSGFAGLAIDYNNCIVLSINKVMELANKYKLFIYGIE